MDNSQHDRAVSIARGKLASGDPEGAKRFCKKALTMKEDSSEAFKLLDEIEKEIASPSRPKASTASSSTSTATETHPTASTTHSRHPTAASSSSSSSAAPAAKAAEPEKKRDYTPEQAAVVKRVRTCKTMQFYEILSVEKTCSDGEVKKAYRKLALALHPDKNGAPGADEAFKLVSKAFQILSDPDKRAVFDRDGADPDSRASMSSSPFNRGGGGGGFSSQRGFSGAQEVNPEDLFNMFFGGGGGGFGGNTQSEIRFLFRPFVSPSTLSLSLSPSSSLTYRLFVTVSAFSFGNGGFQSTRRTTPQARRPTTDGPPPPLYVQLLPLLILFGFSLLTILPSLFGSPSIPPPTYSFQPHPPSQHTVQRQTSTYSIPYFVNQKQFESHPIWESIPEARRGEEKAGKWSGELRKWEREVEMGYVRGLQGACRSEMEEKERRIEEKRGFFGIGADWDEVRRLQTKPLESCEKLKKLNLM
ncbi:hypothetical protein BDY24DRAFT_433487 [Mrakia frigida]|uniref:J domain-containing protein n=1 Tax=Mrakia frigida TaxID=29902 RepID=UPI003FCC0671